MRPFFSFLMIGLVWLLCAETADAASRTKLCRTYPYQVFADDLNRKRAQSEAIRLWRLRMFAKYKRSFNWKLAKRKSNRCRGKYQCIAAGYPCGKFTQSEIRKLPMPRRCWQAGTLKRARDMRCEWYAPWRFR